MKSTLKCIGGLALGLACLAGTARAELVLSGSTAGFFQGTSSGFTEITNTPDGSFASFLTGVPIFGSFQSGVVFESADFAGVQSGDTFAFGMLSYYNGRTLIGTSSAEAMFDFYLDLDMPDMDPLLLTTITFGIDATINVPGSAAPDLFTASFTQPPSLLIGDTLVKFKINDLPVSAEVREGTVVDLGNITVTFTPVPEPSTYGAIAAAALLGLVGYRRLRARREFASTSALA